MELGRSPLRVTALRELLRQSATRVSALRQFLAMGASECDKPFQLLYREVLAKQSYGKLLVSRLGVVTKTNAPVCLLLEGEYDILALEDKRGQELWLASETSGEFNQVFDRLNEKNEAVPLLFGDVIAYRPGRELRWSGLELWRQVKWFFDSLRDREYFEFFFH
jgi:hypothetical protein